jgi:hypothetical protein
MESSTINRRFSHERLQATNGFARLGFGGTLRKANAGRCSFSWLAPAPYPPSSFPEDYWIPWASRHPLPCCLPLTTIHHAFTRGDVSCLSPVCDDISGHSPCPALLALASVLSFLASDFLKSSSTRSLLVRTSFSRYVDFCCAPDIPPRLYMQIAAAGVVQSSGRNVNALLRGRDSTRCTTDEQCGYRTKLHRFHSPPSRSCQTLPR